jgi:enamine deaminase RidA (YjgF/YER057c/UK114 family)
MVRKAKTRNVKRAAMGKARKASPKTSRSTERASGLRRHDPASIARGSNYTHGIEVPPGARFLGIAGQVGRDVNGYIPDGIEAQATLAWANVKAVLAEAGMEMSDIVHYFSILVRREDNDGYDKARVAALGDARPASTKIYVAGLARPEILCEVQVFAAKVGGSRRRAR